ncbi:MAG: hypothetical protein SV487_05220 [Thermodesulfobacteriota bacterium]|nr:hypothetical protein [Thermodesulfobacteriota bacterium]
MKRIPLDKAEPGMILGQKIVREDGVLLCRKGSELSGAMLNMLRRMNYKTVPIETASSKSPEERAAQAEKEEAAIKARFSRAGPDPVLAELRKALITRLYGED